MFSICKTPVGVDEFIEVISSEMAEYEIVSSKKTEYYNVPASFDIEVSSFYVYDGENLVKNCCMYIWMFGINGHVTYGRTWDEYETLIAQVSIVLGLNSSRRLDVWIHNLSYEFQFIKDRFLWDKIFSLDKRKPVYAVTDGIEYKCSYRLTGYKLETVGKNLQKYKVEKKVGDLDYKKIRHSGTPLTDAELGYCINDVLVVMACIQEKIEEEGDITKIPMTKTGYVRRLCRNSCMYTYTSHKRGGKKFRNYRNLMKSLTLSPDEYKQLKRAFQGGFTHASCLHSDTLLENVDSYDFTSSYPYVMVSEKFPMSTSRRLEIKDEKQLNYYLKNFCCLFDVQFEELETKEGFEHPLSFSKCSGVKKPYVVDNGRIAYASELRTTITECDWEIYSQFYTWKSAKIYNFRYYVKGYLPTEYVKAILELYEAKTTLKDVVGKEVEYLGSKEMVNACYGMMVTDICRPEIMFDGLKEEQWSEEAPDIASAIDKYNKSYNRFLFYPWGVWVTAYARRNLFTGIYSCADDYVYSDTDSIKILNASRHLEYIEEYNNEVIEKLEAAMEFHHLPMSLCSPKTVEGVVKTLGVWEHDASYLKFKTVGAKRYMFYKWDKKAKRNKISITVAGVAKDLGADYLESSYSDPFEAFEDGMIIPADYSGKKTLTYIDTPMFGSVTDYLGNVGTYYELSGIHMENAQYKMSMSEEYVKFLMGVVTEEMI